MLVEEHFFEHHQFYFRDNGSPVKVPDEFLKHEPQSIFFKGNVNDFDYCCFLINNNQEPYTSYFIGIDWVNSKQEKAIYVQPKLNQGTTEQVDYVSMLFSLLKHPETIQYVDDIYEIKWDSKPIEIPQVHDQLTPLLIVQFLQVLKQIVRKGLKKSYYKVEQNLYAKVKGKVLVAPTIKHNLLKNKPLNTFCSFDEFGFNGLENRLLKKALVFVKRYLGSHPSLKVNTTGLESLFNYISPAFENVSEEVNLNDVKHTKANAFYKEYEEGLRLAKLILKKFGYNITNTNPQQTIKTPPFWIDMSKLFELYVLGLLKDVYGDKIIYQFGAIKGETYYGQPDFILRNEGKGKIIDTKYKQQYQKETVNFDKYLIKDIRQLSAYARDNRILKYLTGENPCILDCLIIYPDVEFLKRNEKPKIQLEKNMEIKQFNQFYKLSVKLPVVEIKSK